jgi:hypothetical protein
MDEEQLTGTPTDDTHPVRREMDRRRMLLRAAAGTAAVTAGVFTPPRIAALDFHLGHAGASKDSNKDAKDLKDADKNFAKDEKDIKDADKDLAKDAKDSKDTEKDFAKDSKDLKDADKNFAKELID